MSSGLNQKTRLFCVITLGEIGGAQQFLATLVNHLDPERFEIMVVTGAEGRQDIAAELPAHVTWRTAAKLQRSLHPFQDLAAVRELRQMMGDFRPDIVFLNSSKAGFVGSRAAHKLRTRMPGLRVIYRIGGWSFNDPWPRWKRRLFIWMERWSAHWKDIIVVNNTHDLEQGLLLRITPRHETVLIHNGIDPYRDALSRDSAREELVDRIEQLTSERPRMDLVAGTIANLYPTKGIEILLEAVPYTDPRLTFIIIGDGPLREHIRERIGELNLERRVFLAGLLPDARRYLPAFDLFVLPSRKEGFPWSVLEAMAAKIPVVATRVGAIPEMFEHEVSGLVVEPDDPTALAKAITRLITGPEQVRQNLAISAHQRLLASFTLRTMLVKYERLFLGRTETTNS